MAPDSCKAIKVRKRGRSQIIFSPCIKPRQMATETRKKMQNKKAEGPFSFLTKRAGMKARP